MSAARSLTELRMANDGYAEELEQARLYRQFKDCARDLTIYGSSIGEITLHGPQVKVLLDAILTTIREGVAR